MPIGVKLINANIDKLSDIEKVSWLQNIELLSGKGLYSYPQMLQAKITLLANRQLNEQLSAQLLRDLDFSCAEVIPPELYPGYSHYLSEIVQSRFADHYLFSEEPKHGGISSYDPALLQLTGAQLAMPGAIDFAKQQRKAVLATHALSGKYGSSLTKVGVGAKKLTLFGNFEATS